MDKSLLDKETQEMLAKILVKENRELSKLEIAVLRARKDYLTKKELARLADVLEPKKKETKTNEPKKPDTKKPEEPKKPDTK